MGHADVDTTSRYLHHKSRADDADLLAGALRIDFRIGVACDTGFIRGSSYEAPPKYAFGVAAAPPRSA